MGKNNKVENKVDSVELGNLGVRVNCDEAVKFPLIFVPGIQNRVCALEYEPYRNAVWESMENYVESFDYDGVVEANYINQYLFKQFMDVVMTNAHIILNSGLLNFIEGFSTDEAKRSDLYKSYTSCSVFMDNVFCDQVYTTLLNNFSNGYDTRELFIKALTELRALYATKISHWLYYFINEITMNGYVNVTEMGKYMVFGDTSGSIIKADQLKQLEVSFHSVCVDGLLEMANADLNKICEIIEPTFVHLFYNVTDFRHRLSHLRKGENISE